MTKALRIPLLIFGLLVVGYAFIRSISISLAIPDEAVAATGGALSIIAAVIATILLMLLVVWVISRVRLPARAAAAVAPRDATPARERAQRVRSPLRLPLGGLVRFVMKVILAITVFMAWGFAEEFILYGNRIAYPQPEAWWWNNNPSPPLQSLGVAVAFFVVSFLIVFILNFRAGGADHSARNVVVGTVAVYGTFSLLLKIIT